MHYPVFEHYDTLSIAFLVCIILYIGGKQFRCCVFTFAQYISTPDRRQSKKIKKNSNNVNTIDERRKKYLETELTIAIFFVFKFNKLFWIL